MPKTTAPACRLSRYHRGGHCRDALRAGRSVGRRIKRIEDGNIAADVARNTLAAVQTPQVFRKDLLRRALTSAAERGYSFTDDCAAVESLGTIVKATHGSYQNIKITTPEDILVAEALLTREDK
ncbi:MAG: 2-C-methyl-D-erythritol 4-phosphate cytidylyltransferase [Butyricicoccaceae bacterium]